MRIAVLLDNENTIMSMKEFLDLAVEWKRLDAQIIYTDTGLGETGASLLDGAILLEVLQEVLVGQLIVEPAHEDLVTDALRKLLLHAQPGGIIDAAEVERLRGSLSNLTVVDVGPGIHYVQEDNPHGIGEAIAEWWQGL